MPQNAFQKLVFAPGIDRTKTQYASEGGWYSTNKVRFHYGYPEKIGGWDRYIEGCTTGVPKIMKRWRTLDQELVLAIATTFKIYIEIGGVLTDITPIRRSVTLSAPLTTTVGSTTVLVTDLTHGAVDGAFVTLSGASGFNGIPADEINKEHQITVIDNNTWSFEATTAATVSGSGGGGASVLAEYQLNPEAADSFLAPGFGTGAWSEGTWGTPRETSGTTIYSSMYSFALWGEDLLLCPYGKAIYRWDATFPYNRATILPNAPTQNYFILTTRNRHLVCFGCNEAGDPVSSLDPLRIQWCTQEDLDVWEPLITNTAGDYLLSNGVAIQAVAEISDGYLIWTQNTLFHMSSVGPPYVFSFRPTATITGIASPYAHVTVNNSTYWMSSNGFYVYEGGVNSMPCSVESVVFDNYDQLQANKVFAYHNSQFNEIGWFFVPRVVAPVSLIDPLDDQPRSTIYVTDTAAFPREGEIIIEDEIISYTNKRDTVFLGCTRGASGTTIAPHEVCDNVSLRGTDYSKEPSNYVTFNLNERVWWDGRLERSSWLDQGVFDYPLATTCCGCIWAHEFGVNSGEDPLPATIESSDFDIGEGDRLMFVRRMVPDFDIDSGTVTVRLLTRRYSQSDQVEELIGVVDESTEKIDTRIRGRQASIRICSFRVGDKWRYGALRLDMQTDGRR